MRQKSNKLALAPSPVFTVTTDMFDQDDVFVLDGVERDNALGGATGDPDAHDRAANQQALRPPA